jgi:hypothetical protein
MEATLVLHGVIPQDFGLKLADYVYGYVTVCQMSTPVELPRTPATWGEVPFEKILDKYLQLLAE